MSGPDTGSSGQSRDGTERTARYSDPITERGGLIGRGAVLYDTREPHARPCCARPESRCLAHVVGVYEETTTDEDGVPVHPLEKLRREGEKRAKKAEKEKVHCPACDTTVWKDSIEKAIETAETHDEKRHDGESTAKVNGMLLPSDELAEAAAEAVEKLRGDN